MFRRRMTVNFKRYSTRMESEERKSNGLAVIQTHARALTHTHTHTHTHKHKHTHSNKQTNSYTYTVICVIILYQIEIEFCSQFCQICGLLRKWKPSLFPVVQQTFIFNKASKHCSSDFCMISIIIDRIRRYCKHLTKQNSNLPTLIISLKIYSIGNANCLQSPCKGSMSFCPQLMWIDFFFL